MMELSLLFGPYFLAKAQHKCLESFHLSNKTESFHLSKHVTYFTFTGLLSELISTKRSIEHVFQICLETGTLTDLGVE